MANLKLRLAATLIVALAVARTHAATYTWDTSPGTVGVGNGTITGGTGAWNTTNGNWTTDGGVNNIAWPTSGTDNDAVFGGTAGTVTIAAGGVTANDLTFNNASGTYDIAGATLTLNGTTPTLTVNGSVSDYIHSVIAGSGGFVKEGTGNLTLFASNSISGGLTVNAGTVQLQGNASFNVSTVPGTITVNNGAMLVVVNGVNLFSTSSNDSIFQINGGGIMEFNESSTEANTTYFKTVNLSSANGTLATVRGYTAISRPDSALRALAGASTINSTGSVTNLWSAGLILVKTAAPTDVAIDTATGNTLNLSGSIRDLASFTGAILVKTGAGILNLSRATGNSFIGGVKVNGGTLLVTNTSGSATGSGTVTVASGAAIGGKGIISNNLTLANGAHFVFDLNYVDANALTVGGTFTWNSSFGVDDFVAADGSAVNWASVSDGVYKILNTSASFNSGNIENFGVVNAFSLGGGRIAYFSQGSLNLNIETVVSVPAPMTLPAGLGLIGMLAARRRH
ncbi:MAG: hypothetical protein GC162_18300 [Planctomycetes bacterium]|nr:hypothetical protein [Planctomycetota bacterium]